jgi:ABC-2 type transport system permease protein
MLNKLWAIAWKDIYVAFRDRNAMIYMFAMPLALSVIIGLAFGTSGDVEIDRVPVAVINQDQGTTLPGGGTLNLGQTLQDAFVPTGDAAVDADFAVIHDLTDGEIYQDAGQARKKVEDGDLAAMIEIPDANFSGNVLTGTEPQTIGVFYDSGRSVGPSVVRSIVNGITNGMNTVILAQRVGPAYLEKLGAERGQDQAAVGQAVGRLSAESMAVAQSAPIRLEQVDLTGDTRTFDALQYFAPSMAILFMTFAMATGGTGILNESRRWTLQRIVTTPTPRWLFMGGKLFGTYLTGVVQMIILVLSTTLVARMMGRETAVWGHNLPGLALMILVVVFTGTSLGLVIAALSKTPEQASSYSSIALFVLGMLGGSFIPIENLPDAISWLPRLTLNYWGIDGFFNLATEDASIGSLGTNVLALIVMGVVFFVLSLWRFSRRLDI